MIYFKFPPGKFGNNISKSQSSFPVRVNPYCNNMKQNLSDKGINP